MKQPYSTLEESIESGREMLSWTDNWDDEGSIKYSPELFEKLVKFVKELHQFEKTLPIPHIMPGPVGSFDIQWVSIAGVNLVVNYSDSDCISYAIQNDNDYRDSGQFRPELFDQQGVHLVTYIWIKAKQNAQSVYGSKMLNALKTQD